MGWNDVDVSFETLVGKTLAKVEVNEARDEILFTTDDNQQYKMFHDQDCCESVGIEDIVGDLEDLIGTPIVVAEVRTNDEDDKPADVAEAREKAKAEFVPQYEGDEYYDYHESETWTFYEIRTIKGSVTLRWYGSSNGYYSESVSFIDVTATEAKQREEDAE